MRYYEDIEVGDVHEFGAYEVTEEEIVNFAEQYDPQPFHVDPEGAEESAFGELVASGWHTASICMRMLVDNHLNESASAGARGVRELKWLDPVRPGDVLSVRLEVLETEPASNPRIGNVVSKLTGIANGDREVIQWTADSMFERREAER
jgi:acyl dehydratase